jgi:NodT family efflux transporter outer membrane factor (OMF) lipoprotein
MRLESNHLPFVLPFALCLLPSLSCTVGPNYHAPETALPAAWGDLGPAATRPSVTTTRPMQITQWWATFNDPMLDSLIDRAVRANLDLRQARARVVEARAQRVVAAAGLYPSLDFNPSYQHARISKNGVAGFSGGGITVNPSPNQTGSGAIPGAAFPSEFDLYQLEFDASWEIDVFGGTRRGIEATNADLQASVENQRDVLLTVLAEVARNYVELRGLQRQLDIARANLQSQRETLDITRDRAKNGLTTELDVSRAIAQVATTAATLPSLDAAIRQAIDRLALLISQAPDGLTTELLSPAPIPPVPPEVPVGLPSDLLRRRPDVRRAERELAAATARIGVATADLFPRFSLTGATGLQSLDAGNLFDWGSRYYSIGPSVRWHVFDAGRIRANIKVQDARQQGALAAYQKAVLSALQDAHTALVNYGNEQDRRQSLRQAVDADRTSLDLARQQYRQGVVDFLTVLDAQRNLLTSEDALARSDQTVSSNLVSLYKVLGGGWEIEVDNARR